MAANESGAEVDFHTVNRRSMVEYFRRGCKHRRMLGFELEHVLVHKDGTPVSYSQPGGVRDILQALVPYYMETVEHEGDIMGLRRPQAEISIEPAGQLEISCGPFQSAEEVEQAYWEFRNELDPILDEFGVETPMLGYNPVAKALDLELIPKFRYDCMTRFLGAQAPEGIHMMRGSAALQVSIDFDDESDALRKLRIAEKLAPIIALMCDNSPIYEGEKRKRNMVRADIWAHMRQDRVGTVPGSLREDFSFEQYADYIMTREAILVPDPENPGEFRYVADATFDEVYADRAMTEGEIEHALSMVWPDVRLKNFLEIRPADAMPIEYCLAYTAFIKNLFYNKRNLDVLDVLLADVTEDHVRQAKTVLMDEGYGGSIYGRTAEFWADQLIALATSTVDIAESAYLEPFISMVRYRFTLADAYPKFRQLRNPQIFVQENAPVIGVVPRYDFEWTGLSISDNYLSGVLETGGIPVVLPLVSEPSYIARIVQSCDGFLVPGGQDIDPAMYGRYREPRTHRAAFPRDAMERELITQAVAAGKPILGVCRGMQAINVALGGTLYQDLRTTHPHSPVSHVQGRPFDIPAHMVELEEGTKLASAVGALRLGVNTLHHQSVADLGAGLVVAARCPDDGVVEAVELEGDQFVVGVQWHPEHMWRTRPHSKRLFRAFVEAALQAREARFAE